MIAFSPVVTIHMDSYYAKNMIHATLIQVIMIARIDVLIGCGYGSKMRMEASTLYIAYSYKMNMMAWIL
jgi:hypothetical protein